MTEVDFEGFVGGLFHYLFSHHMDAMLDFAAAGKEADDRGLTIPELVKERKGIEIPGFLNDPGWLLEFIDDVKAIGGDE